MSIQDICIEMSEVISRKTRTRTSSKRSNGVSSDRVEDDSDSDGDVQFIRSEGPIACMPQVKECKVRLTRLELTHPESMSNENDENDKLSVEGREIESILERESDGDKVEKINEDIKQKTARNPTKLPSECHKTNRKIAKSRVKLKVSCTFFKSRKSRSETTGNEKESFEAEYDNEAKSDQAAGDESLRSSNEKPQTTENQEDTKELTPSTEAVDDGMNDEDKMSDVLSEEVDHKLHDVLKKNKDKDGELPVVADINNAAGISANCSGVEHDIENIVSEDIELLSNAIVDGPEVTEVSKENEMDTDDSTTAAAVEIDGGESSHEHESICTETKGEDGSRVNDNDVIESSIIAVREIDDDESSQHAESHDNEIKIAETEESKHVENDTEDSEEALEIADGHEESIFIRPCRISLDRVPYFSSDYGTSTREQTNNVACSPPSSFENIEGSRDGMLKFSGKRSRTVRAAKRQLDTSVIPRQSKRIKLSNDTVMKECRVSLTRCDFIMIEDSDEDLSMIIKQENICYIEDCSSTLLKEDSSIALIEESSTVSGDTPSVDPKMDLSTGPKEDSLSIPEDSSYSPKEEANKQGSECRDNKEGLEVLIDPDDQLVASSEPLKAIVAADETCNENEKAEEDHERSENVVRKAKKRRKKDENVVGKEKVTKRDVGREDDSMHRSPEQKERGNTKTRTNTDEMQKKAKMFVYSTALADEGVCCVCQIKCSNRSAFQKHIHKMHQDLAPYTCMLCESNYFTLHGLITHLKMSHRGNSRNLGCRRCKHSFDNQKSLEDHLRSQHSLSLPLTCDRCHLVFEDETVFKKHLDHKHKGIYDVKKRSDHGKEKLNRNKQSEKKEKKQSEVSRGLKSRSEEVLLASFDVDVDSGRRCGLCDVCVDGEEDIWKHNLDTHSNVAPYECKDCDEKQFSFPQMVAHRNQRHEQQLTEEIACCVCGEVFKSRDTVETHLETEHQWQLPVICKDCGRLFSTEAALLKHIDIIHSARTTRSGQKSRMPTSDDKKKIEEKYAEESEEASEEESSDEDVKKLKSVLSSSKFSLSMDVGIPSKSKRGKLRLMCQYCDRRFAINAEFREHLKEHPAVFKCELCNISFRSERSLMSHQMGTHTTTMCQTTCCKICDEQFFTTEALKAHSIIHEWEEPIECSVCGEKVIDEADLLQHLDSAHKEDPYGCLLMNSAPLSDLVPPDGVPTLRSLAAYVVRRILPPELVSSFMPWLGADLGVADIEEETALVSRVQSMSLDMNGDASTPVDLSPCHQPDQLEFKNETMPDVQDVPRGIPEVPVFPEPAAVEMESENHGLDETTASESSENQQPSTDDHPARDTNTLIEKDIETNDPPLDQTVSNWREQLMQHELGSQDGGIVSGCILPNYSDASTAISVSDRPETDDAFCCPSYEQESKETPLESQIGSRSSGSSIHQASDPCRSQEPSTQVGVNQAATSDCNMAVYPCESQEPVTSDYLDQAVIRDLSCDQQAADLSYSQEPLTTGDANQPIVSDPSCNVAGDPSESQEPVTSEDPNQAVIRDPSCDQEAADPSYSQEPLTTGDANHRIVSDPCNVAGDPSESQEPVTSEDPKQAVIRDPSCDQEAADSSYSQEPLTTGDANHPIVSDPYNVAVDPSETQEPVTSEDPNQAVTSNTFCDKSTTSYPQQNQSELNSFHNEPMQPTDSSLTVQRASPCLACELGLPLPSPTASQDFDNRGVSAASHDQASISVHDEAVLAHASYNSVSGMNFDDSSHLNPHRSVNNTFLQSFTPAPTYHQTISHSNNDNQPVYSSSSFTGIATSSPALTSNPAHTVAASAPVVIQAVPAGSPYQQPMIAANVTQPDAAPGSPYNHTMHLGSSYNPAVLPTTHSQTMTAFAPQLVSSTPSQQQQQQSSCSAVMVNPNFCSPSNNALNSAPQVLPRSSCCSAFSPPGAYPPVVGDGGQTFAPTFPARETQPSTVPTFVPSNNTTYNPAGNAFASGVFFTSDYSVPEVHPVGFVHSGFTAQPGQAFPLWPNDVNPANPSSR